MARRILNFLEGLLNLVTMLIIVVVGVYAGYALWDNEQIYQAVENVQADMIQFKPTIDLEANIEQISASFEELSGINPDVIAWLTLDNTRIDYPVLYGPTNREYLNRDVYRNFTMSGSIFLDSRCNSEYKSRYSLVHGHHMSDGKMFGDLDLYKDAEFFRENRTGLLVLPDRVYKLKTIACMVVAANDKVIFDPDPWVKDIKGVLEYARTDALHKDAEIIERMLKENELADETNWKPQMLSLGTCSGEFTDARTVILAEMIPMELAENEEDVSE